ncbi:hypothetical protein SAMN06265218_103124 [Fodinibius sediminis]|uniref:Uncharacterized protein n=1 Tax=Fodinibius sediminis TaxID=1214077 RepID=A0A521BHT1_9BACT|nr:hypothetical protein SAMN06265218_103124 [Fodinibius sediminis]
MFSLSKITAADKKLNYRLEITGHRFIEQGSGRNALVGEGPEQGKALRLQSFN